VPGHAMLAIANVAGHATLAIANVPFLATLANEIIYFFYVSIYYLTGYSTLLAENDAYILWYFVLWQHLTHFYFMVLFVTLPIYFDSLVELVLLMALALETFSIIAAASYVGLSL
jgi:hypothetical protein